MKALLKLINIEFLIGFLTIGGTHLIMLLFFQLNQNASFAIVVGLRVLLVLFVAYYYVRNKPKQFKSSVLAFFALFWLFWCGRLLIEVLVPPLELMHPPVNYFVFFVTSALVPFIYGNFIKSDKSMQNVLNGVICGVLSLVVVSVVMFRDMIISGNVHRLGHGDEVTVTPLAVSYIAAFVIVYFLWKILEYKFKIYYIIPILLSVFALGLGASKGPIFAMSIVLLGYFIVRKRLNYKVVVLFVLIFVIVQNLNFFGLDALEGRMTHSIEANFQDGEREERYYLWMFSIEKFIENPLFGHSLEIRGSEASFLQNNFFSHNIILEAFLSTGLLGGIPLLLLLFITLRNSIRIARERKEDTWLLLFYILVVSHFMVSGTLYGGTWLWIFVGLINGRYKYLSLQKQQRILIE